MDATERLVTYGTLAPGRANHHQLAGLDGRWLAGSVRGVLVESGWGAALGYPALVLDADGPVVDVSCSSPPTSPITGPGWTPLRAWAIDG